MDFSGGENISANPKTLQPNELQLLQGMFADERGYLTTLYPPQKSPDAAHLKDFGLAKSLIKGTSLFYFRSDYSSFFSKGGISIVNGNIDSYYAKMKSKKGGFGSKEGGFGSKKGGFKK